MHDKTVRVSPPTHAKLKRYCDAVGMKISDFVEERLLGALDSSGVESLIESLEETKRKANAKVFGPQDAEAA